DFFKGRDGALITFNSDDTTRTERQQRARKASRARPDFYNCNVLKRFGRARNSRGQIEIKQEILSEGFFRRQTMPADDLAQRREVIDLGHRCLRPMRYFAGTRVGAVAERRAASASAAIRLDGSAVPVPAMSKAVPWSGEVRTNGRPSVTLTAWSKASVLIGINA